MTPATQEALPATLRDLIARTMHCIAMALTCHLARRKQAQSPAGR